MTCELVVSPSGSDPVAIIALIVAAVGLAWGVAWAIATHVLSGQRISVDITKMTSVDPKGIIKSQELLQVTVRATGRVALQVTSWAVMFPLEKSSKDHFHVIPAALMQVTHAEHLAFLASPKLPFTIEPGHSKDIYIPVEPLQALYETGTQDFTKGFIQVGLGARKDFRDKTSLAERMRLNQ